MKAATDCPAGAPTVDAAFASEALAGAGAWVKNSLTSNPMPPAPTTATAWPTATLPESTSAYATT
jgi:hypothetical protein